MRAPKRRRPRREDRLAPTDPSTLAELAQRIGYVISPEHKDYLTAAGPGKLRSDATPCPRGLKFEDVERWLKDAAMAGDVSADRSGDFPRYIWARRDGRTYEARLSNSITGQYKGYPIQDFEAPRCLI